MSSSAHIALLSRQEVEKLSREHVHLKTGDKLEGKVVRLKNDGKVSIDFEKFQAEVELKVPVEKGDVVTVEVMEKGKQIKLKLLDVQSKSGQVNAEPPQEGRQVDPDGGNEGRLIRSKIQQLLKDDIQQPTGANKNKFTNDSDRAASQLKDSLVKLRDILKNTGKTGTTDLKNLSGEIKAILSSLENSGEALNLGEKILEPASQLHAAVKAGATARGEALPKEVTQILSNISKAVDKIGNLGNLEQLPEIKQILRDELKPNVLRLKEILDTGTSGGRQSAGPTSEADIKQSVDQLLKNIDNALERLPDKVDTPGRNAANTPRVERAPAQSATASRSHPPEVRQVTEQITDLKNLVEKAGLSDNKDVVEIVKRLTEAASKIDNFKGPDKLAEIKTIIAKEIKPEVLKLKEVVGRDLPRIETAGRPVVTSAVPDVGRATDDLMRSLEQALDKLPGKIKPESSGVQSSANRTSNAAGDSRPPEVRKVTEQITDLKNLVEKAGLSDNKDVSEIVKRLTEAASKIDRLKGPDQLAELKTILDKEVKSDLLQLKETVTREMFRLKPVERRPARDVTLALNDVLRNLDKAVDKLPDRADIVRSSAPAPARETSNTQAPETAASAVSRDTGRAENIPADTIRADTQRIMEQVADLKQLVETADFPLDKETTEVMDRLSKAAENIARLQTPQQAPEARQILQNELKPDLQLLKEIMGKKAASMNLTPQQSLKRIDTNISKLLGDIQTVLEKLPEPVKASQEIDTLLNEIKNIRRTMENRVDGMEAGDRVASRVSDLKAVMENAGIPFDKDMEAIAAKLAEAVDKISNLKNPDQLAEIKHIIENEIKPNVAALKHIVDQGASARGAPSTQADAAQNDALQRLMRADPGAASEIKERVEDLQKEIESALQKMPDREQADKDNHNLLEEIESALGKIADFSHFNSGQDEEIEMLFENIKLALKQLRFNIQSQSAQSGESPFSIPPDFSEKIANLQLNLQAGSFN
ncbi:MAG: hypothetical protein GY765_14555, partial [bacterium]|nr:hypothetical protein [bacterium]